MERNFSAELQTMNNGYIIHMEGVFDAEAESSISELYQQINIEDGKNIVLNFHDVNRVNSTGIAILLNIVSESKEKGQQIVFCNLSTHFNRIFDIVGLTQFVEIVPDIESAKQTINKEVVME